jgi:hypothetical protein
MKIITHYDPKPIPTRAYDWIACDENYEGGNRYGVGSTEQEAIDDLKEQLNIEDENQKTSR